MTRMDPRRRLRLLRQHVMTDRLLGADVLPIHPMREVEHPGAATSVAVPPLAAGTPPSRPAARRPTPAPTRTAAAPATPDAAIPVLPGLAPPVSLRVLTTQQKADSLAELDTTRVIGCTRCALHMGRTQTVFGEGDVDTPLMFIGEGPGEQEDATGRPFVGPAGELLDKMIIAMGLTRERVYIANGVKCRPPGNRTPTPAEVQTCGEYLHQQIATIQPRIIVTLGGPAAQFVLGAKQGITRIRGTWGEYRRTDPAIPVMPTFHPAYVLRSYTQDIRRKVWSDLQAAMTRLEASQA